VFAVCSCEVVFVGLGWVVVCCLCCGGVLGFVGVFGFVGGGLVFCGWGGVCGCVVGRFS